MPLWNVIFNQSIALPTNQVPVSMPVSIDIPDGTRRLRFKCLLEIESFNTDITWVNQCIDHYLDHPAITPVQKETIQDILHDSLLITDNKSTSVIFIDAQNNFCGRWDASFTDWKEFDLINVSKRYNSGEIHSGAWTAIIHTTLPIKNNCRITLIVEATEENDSIPVPADLYTIDQMLVNEVNLAWYIGELHEHTSHSQGSLSPEQTLDVYKNVGYNFLALTDHNTPPLKNLASKSPITLIRGQEIQWSFGHALLLGVHDWFAPDDPEPINHMTDFIHSVHSKGGLLCVVHPHGLHPSGARSSWHVENMDWSSVDLIEIWSGSWNERFPEILKSFDLWDTLLNAGHRIYGVCGKGSVQPAQYDILEKCPKSLVMSEGASETQLLSALKQGHFYSTSEPAISMRLDSEHGGAFIGDELRVPVDSVFALYIDITQLERAFIRIKTNHGIYCEMPLSSIHDTNLKFYEHATADIQWFRVEIYRYGRPLDQLLAFTNPVFVRGMLSI